MTDLTAQDTSAADRLELGVEDLHVPEPSADAEGVLMKIGLALPVIGVILILVAYWNASGSKYVADQVPMLISGGILGIGLAIIGVGLFIRFSLARLLRFWLARMVVEQQVQTDRIVEALGRIEAKLDK
ncbi:MAG: hypothetical protein JWO77_1874 [Ilumatobacteraceae bacterium]|nr:hypothetical protein [Ilumatobacteraceae bacterium]